MDTKQCFSVDDRVRDADTALLDAEDALANAADVTIAQRALTVAKAFSHRVRNWRDLTRTDMRADAVPAPSDNEARWLLFGAHTMPPTLTFSEESSIHCHLCESCVPWLTRLDSHQKPCVRMPPLARARNMWTSPEPSAIRCLTAAERRIIRLGRLYSTVKRVTAHDVPWGRDHPEALPQYSTKNAIAFCRIPTAPCVLYACYRTISPKISTYSLKAMTPAMSCENQQYRWTSTSCARLCGGFLHIAINGSKRRKTMNS